ncbi:lipopolysaccharide transport periplasmic protein LptA [Parashewanella spongiae]|uniref:Lipopolysaccharide transport periplasmic protein LptA n=1 Tax=Parashewanella spongiae TaxID=342950 RepID=A0A3A6UA47_9GAMM|nr:lipopolysaccharide transport periplasmic protein LptA [Parashewanella spongiae]MCL1077469.1 lipopolysaccharide transport periplasmic protein LptA [Parashewanella spongiae]RJY18394.1 lipopolysaccharide transport periplasmic protein LptA [Parashewanella spongiae]
MKQSKILMAIMCCLLATPSIAKLDDINQIIEIDADHSEADFQNNLIFYKGNVKITQGTIKINAEELNAFNDKQNGNKILTVLGNPATFFQILDDGQQGTASAKKIRYDKKTGTLVLSGNAILDVGGSKWTAEVIRYNIENQHAIAESSSDGNSRVRTVIPADNYQKLNKQEKDKKKAQTEKKQ